MRGLNRTAPLKFDHPGLGATATRMDGKLVIQNDLGYHRRACARGACAGSDGHHHLFRHPPGAAALLPVAVRAARGDLVRGRTRAQATLAGGAPFQLSIATHTAKDQAALEDFLGFPAPAWCSSSTGTRRASSCAACSNATRGWSCWVGRRQRHRPSRLPANGRRAHGLRCRGGQCRRLMHLGDRLCDLLGDEPAFGSCDSASVPPPKAC